jgi:hypothetical protein
MANDHYKHAPYYSKINHMSITTVTTHFIPDSDFSLQKTGCNFDVKDTIPEKVPNTNPKLKKLQIQTQNYGRHGKC